MKLVAALAFAAVGLAAAPALAQEPFSYEPPGVLVDGSGEGRVDEHVYVPGMRFPIEEGPAFANSQVWGNGGSQGPGGGQCDAVNRSYPWHDNYCETRTWDMPLCPAGIGHQGQDIRAATCDKDVHWTVAAADGTITNVGTYSVYLTAEDGTRFDYLHMSNVQVAVGDAVKRGDRLGKVSNQFGGTPTTIHLHFNIRQDVDGLGLVFVPPYMSLITSYQALMNKGAQGEVQSATCERVRGASFDPDTPDDPNDVIVSAGGTWDDPKAIAFEVPADRTSDALCGESGSPCPHGFDTLLPISLLDGTDRDVHVYAKDTWIEGVPVELTKSPEAVTCKVFSTKDRRRRLVEDEDILNAWGFSLFFDQLLLAPEQVDALPEGASLPSEPRLVASPDRSETWILDGDRLRPIDSDGIFAFRLDPASAEVWSHASLLATAKGSAWPSRPVIARGEDGAYYVLDVGVDARGRGPLGPSETEDPGASEAGPAGCACRAGGGRAGGAAGGLAALAIAIGLVSMRFRARRRAATRLVSSR